MGSNPVIAITDQELLKEIMVKDTEAFQDRGNFVSVTHASSLHFES